VETLSKPDWGVGTDLVANCVMVDAIGEVATHGIRHIPLGYKRYTNP
jgi:hypothetical protein